MDEQTTAATHGTEEREAPTALEEGGESACLLDRVCPECGRMADGLPPVTCSRCGTRIEP